MKIEIAFSDLNKNRNIRRNSEKMSEQKRVLYEERLSSETLSRGSRLVSEYEMSHVENNEWDKLGFMCLLFFFERDTNKQIMVKQLRKDQKICSRLIFIRQNKVCPVLSNSSVVSYIHMGMKCADKSSLSFNGVFNSSLNRELRAAN